LIFRFFPFGRRRRATLEERAGLKGNPPVTLPLNFKGDLSHFKSGPGAIEKLCAENPEVLITTGNNALELAKARFEKQLRLPRLVLLVVLTDPSSAPLDEEARETLWRAFSVPLFENLLDAEGNVIARECEIHDGLHIVNASDICIRQGELWAQNRATGLSGSISQDYCECGSETPKLRHLMPLSQVKQAAA
jgi:hypothetical protein